MATEAIGNGSEPASIPTLTSITGGWWNTIPIARTCPWTATGHKHSHPPEDAHE